jgi:hypothetical protein
MKALCPLAECKTATQRNPSFVGNAALQTGNPA